MHPDDAQAVARSLLESIQAAASAHDKAALLDLFTDDGMLLGTAAANLDRDAVERYVDLVLGIDETITWIYDDVRVVDAREGAVTFVGIGTAGFDDGDEPDPFRLTCLAVLDGERWRLRLFHGSVPQG